MSADNKILPASINEETLKNHGRQHGDQVAANVLSNFPEDFLEEVRARSPGPEGTGSSRGVSMNQAMNEVVASVGVFKSGKDIVELFVQAAENENEKSYARSAVDRAIAEESVRKSGLPLAEAIQSSSAMAFRNAYQVGVDEGVRARMFSASDKGIAQEADAALDRLFGGLGEIAEANGADPEEWLNLMQESWAGIPDEVFLDAANHSPSSSPGY